MRKALWEAIRCDLLVHWIHVLIQHAAKEGFVFHHGEGSEEDEWWVSGRRSLPKVGVRRKGVCKWGGGLGAGLENPWREGEGSWEQGGRDAESRPCG